MLPVRSVSTALSSVFLGVPSLKFQNPTVLAKTGSALQSETKSNPPNAAKLKSTVRIDI